MSEKIEPALTAEEWRELLHPDPVEYPDADQEWIRHCLVREASAAVDNEQLPRAIALLNAALKDDDRRKITREKVRLMRAAILLFEDASPSGLIDRDEVLLAELADALESYLPPETP